jgi:hypothetical protein
MVNIEYVGSKPRISSSGVSFDGKEDKYNFINPSIQVLNKILGRKDSLKNSDVLDILYTCIPDFDKFYETKIENYRHKLDLEESKVKKISYLNNIEKDVLLKNYQYMREYRLQRATNKLVYEEIINSAVKLIKDRKIENIKTPFTMNYLHVLESLNTTIRMQKIAMSTKLDIKLEDNDHYIELVIRY